MGRDIQAIKISGEDRRKYRDKVRRSLDAFARMLRERLFDENPSTVGQEIELNLTDARGMPSMRNADALEAIASPAWDTEVGQFNLEINVPPRMLDGDSLATLETELRADLNAADARARTVGSHLVMIGILPTLAEQDVHEDSMSANERYKVLNEQIFAARGEDMRIEIDGAEQLLTHMDSITPESACTSVQLHIQVSPDAFANYWNAAQAIAGVQVALAANSPFLFGRRLWHETRITLFEQATDTRSDELKEQGVRPRVWFGERWITSVFDLFEENLRYFPALLPICEEEDPLAVLDQGALPAAGRDEPAQRHHLPVEPAGLRQRGRHPAPAGGEPGAAGRPHHRRRGGQRGVLLRPGPVAGRGAAADLDPDVVHHRRGEPARGRAERPGRPALLAGRGRRPSVRADPAPPAAAGPRGPRPLGRRRQGAPTGCSASSSSAA